VVRTEAGVPLMPLAVARGIAVSLLAVFGVLHWMRLLEPAAAFRGWEAIGIGALVVAGLLAAARVRSPWLRRLAAAAVALAAFALALLAAGLPDEYLRPDRWGAVAGGVGRGLETLPGARVPFRGLDGWTRMVIAAGGTLLVVLGVALAFWPRGGGRLGYRAPALVALVTLYAVPSIALIFDHEFLGGALLVVLMLAFLRLERLRLRDAPVAGIAVGVVALAGLLAAPALDRDEPWWDYETWAMSSATSKTTAFSWGHDYGPLDWPRDGRELLRVKAKRPTYWKAQNLDFFDGLSWTESQNSSAPDRQYPGEPGELSQANRRQWLQPIEVSVRNLRSDEVVAAGAPLTSDVRPRGAEFRAPGNLVASGRSLRRGDVYRARVYAPDPPAQQLRVAGTNYEDWLEEYRLVRLPEPASFSPPGILVRFPAFGDEGARPDFVRGAGAGLGESASAVVDSSGVSRTWALARELRARSTSPYDFVQEVEDHLKSDAFSYTESPPASGMDLDGFLFDAKQGFCQQYSGAMALLLRMGGVPARVSAGFTSGSRDSKTREWVVRDLDAHSWVEAWFPGHGWVTFDPTPAAAPARSQPLDESNAPGSAGSGDRPGLGLRGLGQARGAVAAPVAAEDAGFPWLAVGIGGSVLALAVAALVTVRRRRARRGPVAPGPAALVELERALRRARRSLAPGTTLAALETRFGGNPGAAGYLRALREQRYRPDASGPSREQRRALRSELARGGGAVGRLRAWWALPPRLTSEGDFGTGLRAGPRGSGTRIRSRA
jgi:transglutaminase-like putative cysteine protease